MFETGPCRLRLFFLTHMYLYSSICRPVSSEVMPADYNHSKISNSKVKQRVKL